MARIETGNTKAVIVLMGVLAVAVAATILRIRPAVTVAADRSPQAGQTVRVPATHSPAARLPVARNPFKRTSVPIASPGDIKISTKRPWPGTVGSLGSIPYLPAKPLRIEPFRDNIGVRPSQPTVQMRTEERKALPRFTLLAVVQGPGRLCGVVKTGSATRVVSVGDSVDGFQVIELGSNRAVLQNGRDTIVADRPDEQTYIEEKTSGD